MVQWLGLGTFTARPWVQSLVKELRSHKLCGEAKKKKKDNKKRKGLWHLSKVEVQIVNKYIKKQSFH